ncbi:MAG: gluconokinase [Acetobacteraceae bacterium]|nr:gluconokinase [Acetobacteraceae bacterium]MBV8526423.1 gluconokinase [Acetobacteraceae bacterium]
MPETHAEDLEREARAIWAEGAPRPRGPAVVVVMGVSASGKTTAAALLAMVMRWRFQEGDELHPPANIAKMRQGIPLNDADRQPWLEAIAAVIDRWRAQHQSGVVACSALKRQYRKILIGDRPDVALVYLKGSYDLIERRMAARHEHFMPVKLLESQFATLEEPGPEENSIVVDVAKTPHDVVLEILGCLAARERGR